MSAEGTGATPAETTPTGANPEGTGETTPDPREEALGDKGKELLQELRKENKELAKTAKELLTRLEAQDTTAATAERERKEAEERERLAAEDKDLTATQKLEKQLQAEREERVRFQTQYQERVVRDDFLSRARTAGIRDEAAAEDLYRIVKSELTEENISDVLKSAAETKSYFFKEKRGTQGHGGAAGTGDGGKGPLLTADEARFAKLTGAKPEDYAEARDNG